MLKFYQKKKTSQALFGKRQKIDIDFCKYTLCQFVTFIQILPFL